MAGFDYRMAVQLQQELERESTNALNQDNQMALLLQEQFERENRNTVNQDKQLALLLKEQYERDNSNTVNQDNKMALLLQEEFNHEMNVERPLNNLVYNSKITKRNDDNTKSLVDPSWEVIDPTPNIHTLFMAFNERYFWNKLLAVCVSWSTRMTTCAGICSYQGRGGMCSIALSEPLLKLRPRKDLVETLLHEMIHAYLFVTHNNKDRDGHGPEFHKHMHRINAETGTNITVYHDFHDEVKLYQQHWWKCNGPCQKWKPHYGIVRRAMNRAPGPSDFWWGQHSRSCGGTFVKVKEPEKAPAKNKKQGKENTKPVNPKNDIRNFLPKITTPPRIDLFKPQSSSTATKSSSNKIVTIASLTPPAKSSTPVRSKATSSNVFNDNAKIKNIHGFHDIDKLKTVRGGTTTYNGGTLVVNKKPATSTITSTTKIENDKTNQNSINAFTGNGTKLSTDTVQDYFASVKDKWLNKLENKTREKRLSNEIISPQSKRVRVEEDVLHDHEIYVNCPVCNKKIKDKELNDHLDNCLQSEDKDNISDKDNKAKKNSSNTTDVSLMECDICNEMFNIDSLYKHKQTCLQNISLSLGDISGEYKECDICKTKVQENIYNQHAEACLLKMFDDIDNRYDTKMVSCLVCKKQIPSGDLNSHLNECMSESVFSNDEEKDEFCKDNSLIEDYENTKNNSVEVLHDDAAPIITETIEDSFLNDNSLIEEFEKNDKKIVICPVCNKKVPVDVINDHLDKCIN